MDRLFDVCSSGIHGKGAFARRRIFRGTRIIEYLGERITHEEADARYDDAAMDRHHTCLMTVNRRWVIDAAVGGNEARFINHSCRPNCEIVVSRRRGSPATVACRAAAAPSWPPRIDRIQGAGICGGT